MDSKEQTDNTLKEFYTAFKEYQDLIEELLIHCDYKMSILDRVFRIRCAAMKLFGLLMRVNK
jgi:hypothetical protein